MNRYLSTLVILLSLLPAPAGAADKSFFKLWNKPAGNAESRPAYTVTDPESQGFLQKLFVKNKNAVTGQSTKTSSITTLPGKAAPPTKTPTLEELNAGAEILKAPKIAAFEKMRAENLEKAAALNKLMAQQQQNTAPTPAANTVPIAGQPAPVPAKKTIYLKPGQKKPEKTFPR